MDKKGQVNIELLLCIILSIMILITIIPYLNQNIESNLNTENNLEGRILLNQIANDINQVNSNMYGFSKYIQLPDKIENNNYLITVKTTEIILEYKNKKGKSNINPINIINSKNESLFEIKLYNGCEYKISKELINNTQNNIINQSSILISQVN